MKTRQIYLGKYQAGDHEVNSTGRGLVCNCGFNGDCEHVRATLEFLKKAEFGTGFKIMERCKLQLCKFCNSSNLIKKGIKKNKNGNMQMYGCRD